MNTEYLEKQLRKISDRERHYKKNNELSRYYDSLNTKEINNKKVYVIDGHIPAGQNFTIIKHTRFVPVPTHIHNFIELNYVYSGTCVQYIHGKKVVLEKEQICLIDTAVPHSIENTSENDIIINILINKNYFTEELISNQLEGGIVFKFILDALSEKQTHDQYIVFRNEKENLIRLTMQYILNEFYSQKIGSNQIIEKLISTLFILLVREYNYETNKNTKKSSTHIVDILEYIDINYLDADLKSTAEMFNYTPSYLSTLIKKETGTNFSNLIIEKKLHFAQTLIINTDFPIYICAEKAGFSNISFFYKKYKKHFGVLPSENSPNNSEQKNN